MKTGISTLVTINNGYLIYVPQKWNFDSLLNDPQNQIIKITSYPNITGNKQKNIKFKRKLKKII